MSKSPSATLVTVGSMAVVSVTVVSVTVVSVTVVSAAAVSVAVVASTSSPDQLTRILSGFTSIPLLASMTIQCQILDRRKHTDMDPILAVKFLYGLTNTPQDLSAFRQRKSRVSLDQAEQSASEVRIGQNTFLFVAVKCASEVDGSPQIRLPGAGTDRRRAEVHVLG